MKIVKDAEKYAKELLKPAPKTFKRRTVKTYGIKDIFGSDICDMSNISKFNDNLKYRMSIRNVFLPQPDKFTQITEKTASFSVGGWN